jgi:hypothetical protein
VRTLAALAGLAAFALAAAGVDDLGVTWDEPGYLESAKLQVAWLRELPGRAADGGLAVWASADTLERYWHASPYANPHPPFYKTVAGAAWALFHEQLGDYPAFRLAPAALFGLTVGLLLLWGASAASTAAGAAAAGALVLMPRVFGDAHVAATDMPLTAFWTLAAWGFWRAQRDRRLAGSLAFGAGWGMALATKFTGILLAAPLVAWGLVAARPRLLRTLVVGAALAAGLLLALHPWLWPDPVGRWQAFLQQSTTRSEWIPIWTWYLGRVYAFVLPWHHAPVMTLVTVPLPLLALAGLGAARVVERARRPLALLCLVEIAFFQALMALPSSPGHDGVRLFLPQFPFVALLAGLGFERVLREVRARVPEGAGASSAAAAAAVVLFVPPAVTLARTHPHELAYYNELVGGAVGAHRRGFESTYWFDAATPDFLRRMERALPAGAEVWTDPAPWHFRELQDAGLLRRDLVFTDRLPAPWLLLMTRQGQFRPFQWRLHRSVAPVVEESYDGVTLMALYRWR